MRKLLATKKFKFLTGGISLNLIFLEINCSMFCTHPTSLAIEECRDMDFGDISNSESDLKNIAVCN